jgi:hypothetical protein
MESVFSSPMAKRIDQIRKYSTPVGRIKHFFTKQIPDFFWELFSDENQAHAQTFAGKILFGVAACAIFLYAFGAIILSLPHWGNPEILQSWLVLPLKIIGL